MPGLKKLRKVSIIVGGSCCRNISFESLHSYQQQQQQRYRKFLLPSTTYSCYPNNTQITDDSSSAANIQSSSPNHILVDDVPSATSSSSAPSSTEPKEIPWKQTEDAILRAAVDTVGLSNWERISHLWFNDQKSHQECHRRAMELNLQTRKFSKNKAFPHAAGNGLNSIGSALHVPAASHTCRQAGPMPQYKHTMMAESKTKDGRPRLSVRKRRELEGMEERKLFGKRGRRDFESQLIHRAYIVGYTKFGKILKMNGAIEQAEASKTKVKSIDCDGKDGVHTVACIEDIDITFSSVMVEMQALDHFQVQNQIRNAAKSITKLPKAINDLSDSHVLSPPYPPAPPLVPPLPPLPGSAQSCNTTAIKGAVASGAYSNATRNVLDRRLINIKSTELPVEKALLDAIEMLTPEKKKPLDKDFANLSTLNAASAEQQVERGSLVPFASPAFTEDSVSFPCLPMTPPRAQVGVKKKTYFMFRSNAPPPLPS